MTEYFATKKEAEAAADAWAAKKLNEGYLVAKLWWGGVTQILGMEECFFSINIRPTSAISGMASDFKHFKIAKKEN